MDSLLRALLRKGRVRKIWGQFPKGKWGWLLNRSEQSGGEAEIRVARPLQGGPLQDMTGRRFDHERGADQRDTG